MSWQCSYTFHRNAIRLSKTLSSRNRDYFSGSADARKYTICQESFNEWCSQGPCIRLPVWYIKDHTVKHSKIKGGDVKKSPRLNSIIELTFEYETMYEPCLILLLAILLFKSPEPGYFP